MTSSGSTEQTSRSFPLDNDGAAVVNNENVATNTTATATNNNAEHYHADSQAPFCESDRESERAVDSETNDEGSDCENDQATSPTKYSKALAPVKFIWTDRDDPNDMLQKLLEDKVTPKAIILRHLSFTPAWTKALVAAKLPVTELELADCRGTGIFLRAYLPKLRRLTFRRMTDAFAFDALSGSTLRALRMECRLNTKMISHVAELMQNSPQLDSINFHRSSFDTELAVHSLADALGKMTKFSKLHLDLSNSKLNDDHIASVVQAMPKMPRSLVLDGNGCRSRGLKALSELVVKPNNVVGTKLSLAHQTTSGIVAAEEQTRQRLDLSLLIPSLRSRSSSLRTLDISHNRFTDDDLAIVWQHLLTSPRCLLTSINVSYNQLTEVSLTRISRHFDQWDTLRSLTMNGMAMKNAAQVAHKIAHTLQTGRNFILTEFRVDGIPEIHAWASLNRGGGRRLLRSHEPVPVGLWARMLGSQSMHVDVVHHLVSEAVAPMLG